MDINKIRTIVNTNNGIITESEKRGLIIAVIAEDPRAIPDILYVLDAERRKKKELISELNTLLSKADAALDATRLNKGGFIQKEVKQFYVKNKDYITHNWKKYEDTDSPVKQGE